MGQQTAKKVKSVITIQLRYLVPGIILARTRAKTGLLKWLDIWPTGIEYPVHPNSIIV